MRLRLVLGALFLAIGSTACGVNDSGGEAATPLTLEERLPSEAEAPGSEPDPQETRQTTSELDEFINIVEDGLVTATEEEATRISEAGFVAGVLDWRFFPAEAGGEHGEGLPHVVTLVAQFDSHAGAADAVDLLHADGLEPCPETCAFDLAEFDVSGIPNAMGSQRIATQERIDQVGDDRPPHAEYTILFADGPFAYSVRLLGPPDEVSERQAVEIATRLYDRVKGARPAS